MGQQGSVADQQQQPLPHVDFAKLSQNYIMHYRVNKPRHTDDCINKPKFEENNIIKVLSGHGVPRRQHGANVFQA